MKRHVALYAAILLGLALTYFTATAFALLFSTISAPLTTHSIWQLGAEQLTPDQPLLADASATATRTTRDLLALFGLLLCTLALIAGGTKLAVLNITHGTFSARAALLPALIAPSIAITLFLLVRFIRPESIPLTTSALALLGAIMLYLSIGLPARDVRTSLSVFLQRPLLHIGLALGAVIAAPLLGALAAIVATGQPVLQVSLALLAAALPLVIGIHILAQTHATPEAAP